MFGRTLALLLLVALGCMKELSSRTLSYVVRESIAVPSNPRPAVIAVCDMDADGNLDIVLANTTTLTILERDRTTFVVRLSHSEPPAPTISLRSPMVAELDGDSTPEIIFGDFVNHQIHILEATGDNNYVVRLSLTVGPFVDGIKAGDSNGDGLPEILVGREAFPSELTVIESTADNTYSKTGILLGDGGNVSVAGAADLDGDGAPEVVFSDDDYSPIGRIYVYENGRLVFTDQSLGLFAYSLGDTDCDGLGEIIGRPSDPGRLIVLESTGSGDGFQVVLNQDSDYSASVLDAGSDGCSELWHSLLDDTGRRRTFTLASRSNSELLDFYNSESLLQGFPGDIRRIRSIGDTNRDGGFELAVLQGGWLHLLEPVVQPSADPGVAIPTLSKEGLILLTLLVLIVSIWQLSGRLRVS